MRARPLRSFLLVPLLAVPLALAGVVQSPRVRADDDRAPYFEGRSFDKHETFDLDGRSIEGWVTRDDPDGADPAVDRFRFLGVREGAVQEMYSAFVKNEGGGAHVFVIWSAFDGGAAAPPVFVVSAHLDTAPVTYAAVRPLLVDAVTARAAWLAGSATLQKAVAEESDDARRPLALAATRALDREFAAHPNHWGVLHDLLVAYQLLLPLEAATDRGANVSFLWRDRLRTQRARFIEAEGDEADSLARTMGTCSLAEGCYALTSIAAEYATAHGVDCADALVAALTALGQEKQESLGHETVSTPAGDVLLDFRRCPDDPPESGVAFHRLTVLTIGTHSNGIPTPVWYSLTAERSGEKSLWALYGHVGGSGRLLRLYGAEEPALDDVRKVVLDLAKSALGAGGGK